MATVATKQNEPDDDSSRIDLNDIAQHVKTSPKGQYTLEELQHLTKLLQEKPAPLDAVYALEVKQK